MVLPDDDDVYYYIDERLKLAVRVNLAYSASVVVVQSGHMSSA